ncbi:MAG TPA: alanine racemase [Lentisphaeria bacterium]|nr:MAG: alanine racemase [Lentisphaerae bacterium GWF2_38_69]HBM16655.1 alanine racemase [Lentisphaeria bacterium]
MTNQKIDRIIEKCNTEEIKLCPFPTGILSINLNKLESNIIKIIKFVNRIGNKNNVKFLLPVKANAYGHGMIPVAKFIEYKKICTYFGVSHLKEALELRENGIKNSILIIGQSSCEYKFLKCIVQNEFEQEISDEQLLYALDAEAKEVNRMAKIHLSVDTGMGRCGILVRNIHNFVDKIKKCKNTQLVGVMTHFPVADVNEEFAIKYTNKQIEIFTKVKNMITSKFSNDIIFHASNSAGTVKYSSSIFDMIRPGIASYGYPGHDLGIPLDPVMEFKTKISLIKEYPKGHCIGYGCTYTTKKKDERIGILPIGYGDGLNRLLSNKLAVIVNGKKEKSIGAISMDQLAISVGKNTQINDEVIIIGRHGKNSFSAYNIASQIGSIPYEVLCNLGNAKRIRHEYIYI